MRSWRIAAKDGDTFAPDALLSLRESFAQYYNAQITSSEGDVIRVIDGLGNGRFVRTVVEKAQLNRNSRIVSSLGLSGADLSDPDFGTDLDADMLTLLTAEDVHYGHQQALPRRCEPTARGRRTGCASRRNGAGLKPSNGVRTMFTY